MPSLSVDTCQTLIVKPYHRYQKNNNNKNKKSSRLSFSAACYPNQTTFLVRPYILFYFIWERCICVFVMASMVVHWTLSQLSGLPSGMT